MDGQVHIWRVVSLFMNLWDQMRPSWGGVIRIRSCQVIFSRVVLSPKVSMLGDRLKAKI